MCSTSENLEEALIEYIKNNEVIYNKASSGYKNIQMKTKIWHEISTKLNVTAEECIRRWKSQGDRYTRELRKLDMPSGSGSQPLQMWDLFETMNFLKVHVAPKQTRGNMVRSLDFEDSQSDLPTEKTTDNNNNLENSSCESLLMSPPPKRPKNKQLEEINSTFMNTITSFQNYLQTKATVTPPVRVPDNDERFAQTVTNLVKSLPSDRTEIAKAAIIKYLAEVNMSQFE